MAQTLAYLETSGRLHACLAVADLDATSAWYRDLLGFRVLQRHAYPEYGVRLVYLESAGTELELVETPAPKPCRRDDPPAGHVLLQGISQLSFRVNDLAETVQQLEQRAIPIVFGPVHAEAFNLKALFIRDNEGNLIEFIERL